MDSTRDSRGGGGRRALEAEIERLRQENRAATSELAAHCEDQRRVWLMLQGLVRKTEEQQEELVQCRAKLKEATQRLAEQEQGALLQQKPREGASASEQLLQAHLSGDQRSQQQQQGRLELIENLAAVCNHIDSLHLAQREQQQRPPAEGDTLVAYSVSETPCRVFSPRTPRSDEDEPVSSGAAGTGLGQKQHRSSSSRKVKGTPTRGRRR